MTCVLRRQCLMASRCQCWTTHGADSSSAPGTLKAHTDDRFLSASTVSRQKSPEKNRSIFRSKRSTSVVQLLLARPAEDDGFNSYFFLLYSISITVVGRIQQCRLLLLLQTKTYQSHLSAGSVSVCNNCCSQSQHRRIPSTDEKYFQ